MSQPGQSRSLPQFDRPLRRLAWVIPASLCLWIMILVGFALMLAKPGPAPSVRPLEVSLADFSHGAPGGSPGGGAGTPGGGEGGGTNESSPSLSATHPLAVSHPAHAVRRPLLASESHVPFASETRRKRPKPLIGTDEEAVASRSNREPVEPEETRPPQRQDHAPTAAPPAPADTAEAASPMGRAGLSAGSATNAGPGPGSLRGAGLGAGSFGWGGAGSGGGTNSGIGAGSQALTNVEHPPVPISRVLPIYPGSARAQGVEGEVVLRAIVDQQGAVERDIVVVESVPMLDRAAIEALRQWRFEPGRDAGKRAVRVVIEVPLRFRLR